MLNFVAIDFHIVLIGRRNSFSCGLWEWLLIIPFSFFVLFSMTMKKEIRIDLLVFSFIINIVYNKKNCSNEFSTLTQSPSFNIFVGLVVREGQRQLATGSGRRQAAEGDGD